MYKTTPLHSPQFLGKVMVQNVFHFVQGYKVTVHFSGDELGKKFLCFIPVNVVHCY